MFCGEISYPWPPFLLGRDRQGVVLSGYLPEMLFCRLRCLRTRPQDLVFEDEGHDASAHLRGEETSAETGGAEHAAPAEAWALIL